MEGVDFEDSEYAEEDDARWEDSSEYRNNDDDDAQSTRSGMSAYSASVVSSDVDDVRAPKVSKAPVIMALLTSLFPLASLLADCVLMGQFGNNGFGTYFWFSLVVLLIAGFYAILSVIGFVTDARGTSRYFFNKKCRLHEKISCLNVFMAATVAAPLTCLQAYVLVAEFRGLGHVRAMVFVCVALGTMTCVLSVVEAFFHWEDRDTKFCLIGFFAALMIARLGAFSAVFVEHGIAAFAFLFFSIAATLVPVMKLRRQYGSDDEPPYLFDDLLWVPPLVCLLTVTPLGGGALGGGGGNDSEHDALLSDDDVSIFGKIFAFAGGAKINTFRSRLCSDVPVLLILSNAAESLAMLCAAAVPAAMRRGSPETDSAATPIPICLMSFLLLFSAPVAYFAAFNTVKLREIEWRRIINDAREIQLPATDLDDGESQVCGSFLVRDINRRSSRWNSVLAKYHPPKSDFSNPRDNSMVYLPTVLKDCHRAYGAKVPDFNDLDTLLASLDSHIWNHSHLRRFDKLKNFLSMRLQLSAATKDDNTQIQTILLNAIRADNVRPMMRQALKDLDHELQEYRKIPTSLQQRQAIEIMSPRSP